MWNDFSYEDQQKVLDKIEEVLLREKDEHMQDVLMAAMIELEIWSNSPIISENEPDVVEAQDNEE